MKFPVVCFKEYLRPTISFCKLTFITTNPREKTPRSLLFFLKHRNCSQVDGKTRYKPGGPTPPLESRPVAPGPERTGGSRYALEQVQGEPRFKPQEQEGRRRGACARAELPVGKRMGGRRERIEGQRTPPAEGPRAEFRQDGPSHSPTSARTYNRRPPLTVPTPGYPGYGSESSHSLFADGTCLRSFRWFWKPRETPGLSRGAAPAWPAGQLSQREPLHCPALGALALPLLRSC